LAGLPGGCGAAPAGGGDRPHRHRRLRGLRRSEPRRPAQYRDTAPLCAALWSAGSALLLSFTAPTARVWPWADRAVLAPKWSLGPPARRRPHGMEYASEEAIPARRHFLGAHRAWAWAARP